jgi:predicted metal-dependent peptidase
MGLFNTKPTAQPVKLSIEESMQKLKDEMDRLENEKKQNNMQSEMDKLKAHKSEQVEAMYLKQLDDVKKVVRLCEEKGWLTKKDWDDNNVPMKLMVTDLLKLLIRYSGMKIDELYAIMKQEGMERR